MLAALLCGCRRPAEFASGPLPQRGYLWQRDWTPAVLDSLGEAERRMDGVILLGAEIVWQDGNPEVIAATIDWKKLKELRKPCALALRVAPAQDLAESLQSVASVALSLIADARRHEIAIGELQLDFDCAQKKLAAYRDLLARLRSLVRPTRLVITTLPAWLDEPEFGPLVRAVDGYVLQVHSVPIKSPRGGAELFDRALAQKWVERAAKLALPFSVALPTYRCVAGYGEQGKLAGVLMDSVKPPWPPGTSMLELAPDADAIATTVKNWMQARPPELKELIWYRVPVASDARNWRWKTLAAVMAGRKPAHQLEAVQEGENPIDLALLNSGEADERLDGRVAAEWEGGELTASDALSGWSVRVNGRRAIFTPPQNSWTRFPPEARRNIGWLRFAEPTRITTEVMKQDATAR